MAYIPRRPLGEPEPSDLPGMEGSLDLTNPDSPLSKKIKADTLVLANALVMAEAGQENRLFELYLSKLDTSLSSGFDRTGFCKQMI